MSLLPLDPHLPEASPPDRRAALELRKAQLRAAPPTENSTSSRISNHLSPVSTRSGEGQTVCTSRRPTLAKPVLGRRACEDGDRQESLRAQ